MTPLTDPSPAPSSLLTRVAVGISIAVHVFAVLLSLGYAGAGLFASDEADAVQVSLVTPEELASASQPEEKPAPDLSKLDLRLTPNETKSETKPEPAAQQAPAPPQAAMQQPASDQRQRSETPQAAAAQPAQGAPAQTYQQPLPDISMRYQVDLGLKMLPPAPAQTASAQDGTSDFDAPAMKNAEIEESNIAAFRARLRQCAALPAQISPDDKVVIVLRATFTPDAKLAAAPVLIEASASAKGPALMQAAIAALQTCQPHSALPAESYAEWRVLDLRFTPQDFKRG